jgi:hypothetical protein
MSSAVFECPNFSSLIHLLAFEVPGLVSSILPYNGWHSSLNIRLAIMQPDFLKMQIRAFLSETPLLCFSTSLIPSLSDAAVDAKFKEKELSFLQIFIPMLATDHEMEEISPVIKSVAKEVTCLLFLSLALLLTGVGLRNKRCDSQILHWLWSGDSTSLLKSHGHRLRGECGFPLL